MRLDLQGEGLWRGTEAVRLRPKSLAVLRYLVAHPGRVVSKNELLEAVWPEVGRALHALGPPQEAAPGLPGGRPGPAPPRRTRRTPVEKF